MQRIQLDLTFAEKAGPNVLILVIIAHDLTSQILCYLNPRPEPARICEKLLKSGGEGVTLGKFLFVNFFLNF